MAKIVTLGEIMLRLSPEGNDRFIQSESLRIIPGGGEANLVSSAALSLIAGVIPLQWNHWAPSIILSKSKSDGSASAIALCARS
jgi:hypothetical protein